MNWIRLLRHQAGMTQQALAVRAGTSQPTVAMYESGAKSPTLSTIRKLSACVGLDPVISFIPRITREDRRSLAYHQVIADKLEKDPAAVINKAQLNLDELERRQPGAQGLLQRWKEWLQLPPHALSERMRDLGMEAREMRQVTPFAGLLTARERADVLKQLRRDIDA